VVAAAITGATTPASNSSATLSAITSGTSQQFMQLLVAQMQYQDPMQPVSSTQFVTQLAQFQMLSVLMAMQKDLDTLVAAGGGKSGGSGSGGATQGSAGGSSAGSAAGQAAAVPPTGTATGG
jgi:flagellar basal-body rod modification protein FlgD